MTHGWERGSGFDGLEFCGRLAVHDVATLFMYDSTHRAKSRAEPANCRISSFQLPSSFDAHSAIELPGLSASAGFEPATSVLRSAFELPDPRPPADGCRGTAQGRRPPAGRRPPDATGDRVLRSRRRPQRAPGRAVIRLVHYSPARTQTGSSNTAASRSTASRLDSRVTLRLIIQLFSPQCHYLY